jgi:hypothetical protein
MICFRLNLAPAALLALIAAGPAAAADPSGMYSAYSNPDSIVVDRAFDTKPASNLDEVVKQLTRAIDRLARYRVPKDPPSIYRIPHAELENYVCGTHCSIKAWYKPGDGIFLDDTLTPETNLFHRSILLHELVHYFQDRAGEYGNMNECERWFHRELDAYTIQNRYLGMIGHPSRVAYVGDNCTNMTSKAKSAKPAQAFDGIRGRIDPDQH